MDSGAKMLKPKICKIMLRHRINLYGRKISAVNVFDRYFVQGKHSQWFKDNNECGFFASDGFKNKYFVTPYSSIKKDGDVLNYYLFFGSTSRNEEGRLMFANSSKELLALIKLEAWKEIKQLIDEKKAIVMFSIYNHCGETTKKHLRKHLKKYLTK
jgi:hypothetical protein